MRSKRRVKGASKATPTRMSPFWPLNAAGLLPSVPRSPLNVRFTPAFKALALKAIKRQASTSAARWFIQSSRLARAMSKARSRSQRRCAAIVIDFHAGPGRYQRKLLRQAREPRGKGHDLVGQLCRAIRCQATAQILQRAFGLLEAGFDVGQARRPACSRPRRTCAACVGAHRLLASGTAASSSCHVACADFNCSAQPVSQLGRACSRPLSRSAWPARRGNSPTTSTKSSIMCCTAVVRRIEKLELLRACCRRLRSPGRAAATRIAALKASSDV